MPAGLDFSTLSTDEITRLANAGDEAALKFISEDIDRILARLDIEIPAAQARMDAIIEKLKQPAA